MSSAPERPPDNLHESEERFRLLVEGVKDYAIFMLDREGHVLTWNAGAQRFKGYAASEIIGQHFSRFYPPEALARDLPGHELRVASEVGSFEDDGFRVRKDGSLFWANVVITAIRDSHGNLLGFSKVTRDLSQRRAQELALRQSEERFRLLVEGVKDYAIFMLDANGHVMTWNSGAERIKGYKAGEIVGRHFSVFYPPEAVESGWPDHELRVAAQEGSFADEGWRLRRDGSKIWSSVTITALRDEEGRLLGFAKVTRDLSDRQRAEALELAHQHREELLQVERAARMAAQRATRIKDEFLATLSHELRSPLSAIVGWTQILKKTGTSMSPQQLAHAVEVIDRNARAQTQLIDDLLDLNRILSGKVRLDLHQISLGDVVRRAVESAEPVAANKEIRLTSILDPSPILVSGDAGRLQQVVWNLLSNAIKFTPKGGRVQVLLQRVNSHVEVGVSDSGIGIGANFLPQVFERFSQQDSSTTRSYGGLGLGLAISKQLVELHGGAIRVASAGENLGATFSVELPVSIAKPPDDRRQREHPTQSDESGESGGSVEPTEMPRLAGVHVMVVDDEPDGRELLQRVLEGQSAKVSAFASAEEALHALQTQRPQVIVSDIGMPRMDGYQFMRSLRASEEKGERIPALALTAFARVEDRKLALLAGFQAHLAKPFDATELMLLLSDLSGRESRPRQDPIGANPDDNAQR